VNIQGRGRENADFYPREDLARACPALYNPLRSSHDSFLPGGCYVGRGTPRPLDGKSNVVYDESGTVYCYDKVSDPPVRHKMSYAGHEPSRGTLKYRCPAMAQRWTCRMSERCNAGKKYGKTVRVKQQIDLRRLPPIPPGTKQFERLYKGRTSVERVNARLKVFWGADDGNITGPQRFHAFKRARRTAPDVGTVMVVHAGLAMLLASTPRKDGPLGRMRLSPIAKALQEATATAPGN